METDREEADQTARANYDERLDDVVPNSCAPESTIHQEREQEEGMLEPDNQSSSTDHKPSKPADSASLSRQKRGPPLVIDTGVGEPSQGNQGSGLMESPMSLLESPVPNSEDRPSSPHNVSSPGVPWNSLPFLSVPGARSRTNSVDTLDSIDSVLSHYHTNIQSGMRDIADFHDNVKDALRPNSGTEADFCVEDNPFAFSPGQLGKLLNPKSLGAFYALGGLDGLERGLRTSCTSGLSIDEQCLEGSVTFEDATTHITKTDHHVQTDLTRHQTIAMHVSDGSSFMDRKHVFGDGHIPLRRHRNLFRLAWAEYCDPVLITLTIAALVTIAMGLYQAVARNSQSEAFSWPEGVAICSAIAIVVLLEAANDWRKERHFLRLRNRKEDTNRPIRTLRSGKVVLVPALDVLVGDIVLFEAGDIMLVDGILIDGHDVCFDESSASGESDLQKKTTASIVFRAINNHESMEKLDPFILSGSKVMRGPGSCIVTATGVRSSWGRIMMSLRGEVSGITETPLQKKLNVLSEQIAKVGLVIAMALFIVLFIKFLTRLKGNTDNGVSKGLQFFYVLVIAITVVDVAIPSGLPLAQTVALALATSRMLRGGILVQDLRACETLGYTTSICLDQTALLSKEPRKVVDGLFGARGHTEPKTSPQDDSEPNNIESKVTGEALQTMSRHALSNTVAIDQLVSSFSADAIDLLRLLIGSTTTALETDEPNGNGEYVGSMMESALLDFAKRVLGVSTITEERSNTLLADNAYMKPPPCGAVSIVKLTTGVYRALVRMPAARLLRVGQTIVADPKHGLDVIDLSASTRSCLQQNLQRIESTAVQTIGFGFRDFESWPPRDLRKYDDTDSWLTKVTFLGVLGVNLPLKADVQSAVEACRKAGVSIRLVSSETASTTKAIAAKCGISLAGISEGPDFRKLSRREMVATVPKLDVLAYASHWDKHNLVKFLIQDNEKVAVVGSGRDLDDVPVLRAASVAVTMQTEISDSAKEASGIVILNDQLMTVLQAILWGRAVSDSLQKFLQFQLTINISAVMLTLISSVESSSEQSVLNSVQLLWVNLIMDMFAILALANDPPTRFQLERKPGIGKSPLITLAMWKMTIGQAVFQIAVCLTLYHTDLGILDFRPMLSLRDRDSVVFNTFVWMQIFNLLNCRRVDNNLNVLEGIEHNMLFVLITMVIVGVQCLLVVFGGKALNIIALTRVQWACSILMGVCTLPVGMAIRCIPDEGIRRLIPKRLRLRKSKKPEIISDNDQWDQGLLAIKDELSFMKKIRGGRLTNLRYTWQYYHHSWDALRGVRSADTSSPGTPREGPYGPAVVMPGIIAGSVAGWSAIGDGPRPFDVDIEAAKGPHTAIYPKRRTSRLGSVSSMSAVSIESGLRRRPMSRPNSISSAISVPGVVAGAIALASPGSEKGPVGDAGFAHAKTA